MLLQLDYGLRISAVTLWQHDLWMRPLLETSTEPRTGCRGLAPSFCLLS